MLARRIFRGFVATTLVALSSASAARRKPDAPPRHVASRNPLLNAKPFLAAHQRAIAANPPGVHLKISLDAGQRSFHIGDTIRVRYELTADEPNKYVAGSRVFDRTPRSTLETFVVDGPADAFDPLHDIWNLGTALLCQHFDSNRTATLKLGPAAPQQDAFEITHYLRFQKPGRYRLYAITRSVLETSSNARDHAGPPLASDNFVSFEILPQDLNVADREVREILSRAQQPPSPRFMPADAFRLFEIATPPAARAAAELLTFRHNTPDSDSIALATLLAATPRKFAVALLDSRLHNPALAIDDQLLVSLSLLRFTLRYPNIAAADLVSSSKDQADRWHAAIDQYRQADFRAALASLDGRAPDLRASSARALDNVSGWRFCTVPIAAMLAAPEQQELHQLHLTTLPDLPAKEMTSELLNFGWAKDFPPDRILPVLVQIYDAPPKENASFIRETTLHVIEKYDPAEARALFRDQILNSETPLDWYRIRYVNLPTGPDLDADFIAVLENRWTERMSRVAPLVGLYATDGILDRVKNVYEVEGAGWPCSIQAGLLTYFLRVDPAYGKEQLGPALNYYFLKGGSDCTRNLLVDIALLRNAPELKPFVESALNDPRPLVAAAGAQITGFGDQGKMPVESLLTRLRVLHEEWPDFDSKNAESAEQQKWNSGYNELERIISINLVNASDSPEHAAAWKKALDLCVSENCRKMMRDRMARSRF